MFNVKYKKNKKKQKQKQTDVHEKPDFQILPEKYKLEVLSFLTFFFLNLIEFKLLLFT